MLQGLGQELTLADAKLELEAVERRLETVIARAFQRIENLDARLARLEELLGQMTVP